MGFNLTSMFTETGVTTYSVNPGLVESAIELPLSGLCSVKLMQCFRPCCYKTMTSDEGASAPVYCCLEPTLANETGLYYWCFIFADFLLDTLLVSRYLRYYS
jgi:hypothetical protein